MAELYLLTPPKIDADFADVLARTLDAGRVSALQLRLKDQGQDEIEALAPRLIEIAHQRGVSVIMNDDPVLAAKLGCDGVHIGQEDGSIKQARAAVGPKGIVGVTCHDSRHLAMLRREVQWRRLFASALRPVHIRVQRHQSEGHRGVSIA